jgi:putative ABC transport system permease protein
MGDVFKEIWSTISHNKLRTSLTGFAVAWGIFMLICLLGVGNGVLNAFSRDSDRFLSNSVEVSGGVTTKAYAGFKMGRWINLDDTDVALTAGDDFKNTIDDVAPTVSQSNQTISLGDKFYSGTVTGVYPSFQNIDKTIVQYGRFINKIDINEKAKVMVIATSQAKELMGGVEARIPQIVGKYIQVGNFAFRVIGVYQTDESGMGNESYAPYSTVKTIFNKGNNVGSILYTFHGINSKKEDEAFRSKYTSVINKHHSAAPDDEGALWIWDRFEQSLQQSQGTKIMKTFLWILGILTLISGVVGVSNIMLISVKERTHEFGIRKAIGAKPRSILTLIVTESVVITAAFGYIGMAIGMITNEIVAATVGQKTVDLGFQQIHMLENPTVGLDVAIEATLLLIIAGTIAGLAPARKASKVRPIEALREE